LSGVRVGSTPITAHMTPRSCIGELKCDTASCGVGASDVVSKDDADTCEQNGTSMPRLSFGSAEIRASGFDDLVEHTEHHVVGDIFGFIADIRIRNRDFFIGEVRVLLEEEPPSVGDVCDIDN